MPLRQSVLAPKGQAQVKLPIALSDSKGAYTLTVREMATGITSEQAFTVK